MRFEVFTAVTLMMKMFFWVLSPYIISLYPSIVTSALKMETVRFSETLASTSQSKRRPNPKEHFHHHLSIYSFFQVDDFQGFHIRILHICIFPRVLATCPAHRLLGFTILRILEDLKSRRPAHPVPIAGLYSRQVGRNRRLDAIFGTPRTHLYDSDVKERHTVA
jgi:hypothetical protein